MLVFIDDSGDPGFKLGKGSTKFFIISCIIFNDKLDAEETALEIKKLRRDLGKNENFEFKFNKCRKDYRIRFLKKIAPCKFKYRAIVMEKDKVYGSELKNSKESFYNFTTKMVLKHSFGAIRNAKVTIDGSGDRNFRRSMKTYLRKQVNVKSDIIRDVKFRNSKNNVLLQLADMVAGTINRSYSDKSDAKLYRKIIQKREDNVWEFCK